MQGLGTLDGCRVQGSIWTCAACLDNALSSLHLRPLSVKSVAAAGAAAPSEYSVRILARQLDNKPEFCISGGWRKVVRSLQLRAGDRLQLEPINRDPLHLRMTRLPPDPEQMSLDGDSSGEDGSVAGDSSEEESDMHLRNGRNGELDNFTTPPSHLGFC